MKCPFCGHTDDRVLDTRDTKEMDRIRRRRECLNCKSRFSTIETISFVFPFVIKKDGRREPFLREKLFKGLLAACQKRPISHNQLDSVSEQIAGWVLRRGEKEISSRDIGFQVMRELKKLDDVAYVRFASVYRSFRDVQEFVETLEVNDSPTKIPPAIILSDTADDLFEGNP